MRIGITGHRDLDARTTAAVTAALHDLLGRPESVPLTGLSCLAAGADQLFAKAVLELGGRLVTVIAADDYRETLSQEARTAYDALLGQAADVLTLPFPIATPEAYLAAGLAVLDRSDLLVAVWDGGAARGVGGTADIVDAARARGIEVVVVWPEGSRRLG